MANTDISPKRAFVLGMKALPVKLVSKLLGRETPDIFQFEGHRRSHICGFISCAALAITTVSSVPMLTANKLADIYFPREATSAFNTAHLNADAGFHLSR